MAGIGMLIKKTVFAGTLTLILFVSSPPGSFTSVYASPPTAAPGFESNWTWSLISETAMWNPRVGHSSVAVENPDYGYVALVIGGEQFSHDGSWLGFCSDSWMYTGIMSNTHHLRSDGAEWGGTPYYWDGKPYQGRRNAVVVALPDSTIVLLGGETQKQGQLPKGRNDVWRSSDFGANWTQVLPHKPEDSSRWLPRYGHSAVVLPDGSIVVMGGMASPVSDDEFTYLNDNLPRNDVWRSTDGGVSWVLVNTNASWTPRSHHTSDALGVGSIVLMGGFAGGAWGQGEVNDVWRSSDMGKTWQLMSAGAPWAPRAMHACATRGGNEIFLTGGYNNASGFSFADTWRSADNGKTWTELKTATSYTPRSRHSLVTFENQGLVVLIGGFLIQAEGRSTYSNDIWVLTHFSSQGETPPQESREAEQRYQQEPEIITGTPIGEPIQITNQAARPETGSASWENVNIPTAVRSNLLGHNAQPSNAYVEKVHHVIERQFETPMGYLVTSIESYTKEGQDGIHRRNIVVFLNKSTGKWEVSYEELPPAEQGLWQQPGLTAASVCGNIIYPSASVAAASYYSGIQSFFPAAFPPVLAPVLPWGKDSRVFESAILDGGNFDLDGDVNGQVKVRMAVITLAAPGVPEPVTSTSGGGGCNIGCESDFLVLLLPALLFLAIPLTRFRRN